MHRFKFLILGFFFFWSTLFSPLMILAADGPGGPDPGTPTEATFQGRCAAVGKAGSIYEKFPQCANSPNECFSTNGIHPLNCFYLTEPIGGKPGYDLFKRSKDESGKVFNYELWYGEFLVRGVEEGPYQAMLVYEEGKDFQGPLALLYNYLGLAYNYISGFILGAVILIAIIGGIEMIVSNGNAEQFGKGQGRLVKALTGMVIWFLASVILYTINPTFFIF